MKCEAGSGMHCTPVAAGQAASHFFWLSKHNNYQEQQSRQEVFVLLCEHIKKISVTTEALSQV